MKVFLARIVSFLFKIYFRLRYGSRVRFGKRLIINHRFQFHGTGSLMIGDDVNMWAHEEPNRFFTYSPGALIKVGDRTRLNGLTIQSKSSVIIRNDCLVGSCMLIDTDFHAVEFSHRNDSDFVKSKPIVVSDRVWLAGQSQVMKGVTVGEESVVGFRAVVTKDVPPRVVVGGNPAMVIKQL